MYNIYIYIWIHITYYIILPIYIYMPLIIGIYIPLFRIPTMGWMTINHIPCFDHGLANGALVRVGPSNLQHLYAV